MRVIYWFVSGLMALWIETALSSYFRIFSLKVDWVFMVMLILTLRWASPFLLFYGLFLGLIQDSLSHSYLGVYALANLSILMMARWIGEWFYNNNIFSTIVMVALFSLVRETLSLTLFKLVMPQVSWWSFFFTTAAPMSLIHGLLSPLLLILLMKIEKQFKLDPDLASPYNFNYSRD